MKLFNSLYLCTFFVICSFVLPLLFECLRLFKVALSSVFGNQYPLSAFLEVQFSLPSMVSRLLGLTRCSAFCLRNFARLLSLLADFEFRDLYMFLLAWDS